MSRSVPSKLVSYSALPVGISAKNFDISFNSLLPTNSTGGSVFAPSGVNRILFTVPAYQNCFLDNGRSHLAFTFETTVAGTQLCTSLGSSCLFDRMVIRSGPNVLEDITHLDVLNKILTSMDDKNESRLAEGCYNREYNGGGLTSAQTRVVGTKQKTGVELNYIFRHGLLHEHLASYLPLHAMNTSDGRAFSIELYLNDPKKVLQWDADAEPAISTASYKLSNVRYQMCLLKADQTIIQRFNNLSGNGTITIPFSTYRSHQNGLSMTSTITQIAEACSDLRKIHTVIVSGSSADINKAVDHPYPAETSFIGGHEHSIKVSEYQLQVGNKYIFTEPLKSVSDNSQLMAQVKNASFYKGNMLLESVDQGGSLRPAYEKSLFHMTSSFCYENSSIMTNGISLGSLPLILKLGMLASGGVGSGNIILSQAECGFNLVINSGLCSVKDSKDASDFGY